MFVKTISQAFYLTLSEAVYSLLLFPFVGYKIFKDVNNKRKKVKGNNIEPELSNFNAILLMSWLTANLDILKRE